MNQTQEEHERRVLGAALEQDGHWLRHAAAITPELFCAYRDLAREICAMTAAGMATDPQSVASYLATKGINVKVSNLLTLQSNAPCGQAAMDAAVEALHETARRAALEQLSGDIKRQLAAKGSRADTVIEAAQSALADIGARSTTELRPWGQVLRDVVGGLGRPETGGVKTGILAVDQISNGFKPGDLVILGARPSMGKTALALGIASRAARVGKSVLVFSLEMSPEQVCQRVLSDLASVNLARIVTHRVSSSDITTITNAAAAAHKWGLHISEDTERIEPVCRQIQYRHGLDLVVVDYLQLMSIRAESREQQIATLSRRLKQLARRLRVPVLALSQLNRQLEQRASKRPMLSDLRESGAIEQDADMVFLLWRPAFYDDAEDPGLAELDLAKNRNGPTGLVKLAWNAAYARFES